jgi:hypothetical protein
MVAFKVGELYYLTEDLESIMRTSDDLNSIANYKILAGSVVLLVDFYSFYQDYVCIEFLYKGLIHYKSISRKSLNKILKEIV